MGSINPDYDETASFTPQNEDDCYGIEYSPCQHS
jgi:hypothetical protein